MKNKNKPDNKNERNIMTTTSKCKMLLCLALPLTLAAAYASDTNLPPATASFIAAPASIVQPVSARRTANLVVGKEMFALFMAETNNTYNLSSSVNNGVVTLVCTSSDGMERQRIVNEVWQLHGVDQVTDESGVSTPQAPAERIVAVR